MKFIDEARIRVKAGDGGRGCVSFRREKYVPRGGPDGGDGGRGGDIIIESSSHCHTLLDLVYRRHYKAPRGGHGRGKNQQGRSASLVIIYVPVGTIVRDNATGELVADLIQPGQQIVVARGGRGGFGNARFVTPTRQAPRWAEEGQPGEERELYLELKLLADVGIIGLPNVGKSTLIAAISSARPRIADYPFTTIVPNLGVVRVGEDLDFVVADVPGLIEGAHEGKGLGHQFLRHVERTYLLLHLLEHSPQEERDPIRDFQVIQKELSLFSPSLAQRPFAVALNKIDLSDSHRSIRRVEEYFTPMGIEVFPISAATGVGVDRLVGYLAQRIAQWRKREQTRLPDNGPATSLSTATA
jgi:GTP-binding protein